MGSAKPISGRVIAATVIAATAVLPGLFANSSACADNLTQDPDEAHPGASIEPLYAEALIELHRGDRKATMHTLTELLRRAPEHVEALALQAQVYQAQGNDPEVVNTYLKLIKIKTDETHLAFFRFELAYTYHRLKKFDLARPLLLQAIAAGFNVAGGNLLLGIEDLQAGKAEVAEGELVQAKETQEISTRIPALYYLAMTEYQLGFEAAGTRQAYESYQAARAAPPGLAPKGMLSASSRLLERIAGPGWFGTVAMLGQYDSNVAIVPGQNLASGLAATKVNLDAGLGKMGAATSSFQWVASAGFNGNLSFPSATTSDFEYETITPSFYLNHEPLSRMPWGFKAVGGFTEQGQTSGFRPFLFGGDLGAYLKYRPGLHSELGVEAGVRPQSYIASDASEFSGDTFYFKLAAARDTLLRAWNPVAGIDLESASTSDASNSYRLIDFQFGDTLRIGSRDRVTAILDLGFYSYSSIGRSDSNLTPRLDWIHPITSSLSLLVDVSYTSNSSTLPDTYAYKRLVAGAGASLGF